jgi:hypothetical protein
MASDVSEHEYGFLEGLYVMISWIQNSMGSNVL